MNVRDPGHCYELNTLDGGAPFGCFLQFVKRKGPNYPGNRDSRPGTTSQEVLRAVIDRALYVNRQRPCWQTRLSIPLLKLAVWLYERRAAKRHGRGAPGYQEATFGETCQACGHVGCRGSCRP